jgi:hypothetical protein
MAVQTLGTTPRLFGGRTGRDIAEGFIQIRLEGQEELIEALLRAAIRAGEEATKPLNAACRKAMGAVMKQYERNVPEVTGNLRKSIQIRGVKGQRARGVGVAIGGPSHVKSGNEWDVEVKGAGNHAWLVEFGTGRRRPSTQGRRTYLNVHQKINQRFTRVGDRTNWFNNEEFERMGRGFYFIMGSRDEPTRQARRGSGYPHDFGPFAIGPNETYGAMPARHAMEKAIQSAAPTAMNILNDAIREQINRLQAA